MPRPPDYLRMTAFYGLFHYIVRQLYDILFRGDVTGTENLPLEGPFLVASNHASHLDPPLVGSQVARQMRFFARKTLWSTRIGSWWLDRVETIPVDRDSGDVSAIKRVLQALAEDRAVILFPEGTRSFDGQLQKPKAGVGLLACKTGVPVVPCRIFGTFEAFGKGRSIPLFGTRVNIVFGPPIPASVYDDPTAGKERYQLASQRIFDRIAALPPPEFAVI
ncbi:MAG TPA: lysophospholipid acyltransferase family protein [Candidatus Didemnitutus sp.]|nr:lysophospholipid acyltransferase family protein [Candidatus Didemnitutus sp.]